MSSGLLTLDDVHSACSTRATCQCTAWPPCPCPCIACIILLSTVSHLHWCSHWCSRLNRVQHCDALAVVIRLERESSQQTGTSSFCRCDGCSHIGTQGSWNESQFHPPASTLRYTPCSPLLLQETQRAARSNLRMTSAGCHWPSTRSHTYLHCDGRCAACWKSMASTHRSDGFTLKTNCSEGCKAEHLPYLAVAPFHPMVWCISASVTLRLAMTMFLLLTHCGHRSMWRSGRSWDTSPLPISLPRAASTA